MGILETFMYPGLADRWFQNELFQQILYVIIIGSLSLYQRSAEYCTYYNILYNTNIGTPCMG